MVRRRKRTGTFIRLKVDTRIRLGKHGRKGQSYDDIINELLGGRGVRI